MSEAKSWAPTREYRCPVAVEQITPQSHTVTSKPPFYAATVVQQGSGVWKVHVIGEPASRDFHDASLSRALTRAGELVSKLAGRQMMTYSAQQRIAMGQQQCPKRLGTQVCRQSASVGSVWCEWHPGGEDRGDA